MKSLLFALQLHLNKGVAGGVFPEGEGTSKEFCYLIGDDF